MPAGNLDPDAPGIIINQQAINAATVLRDGWRRRNKQLYGALLQSLPAWLQVPVYNNSKNNGLGAILMLQAQYDVRDPADYATMVKRLTTLVVEAQSDLSEQVLRSQFDAMSTAQAAIIRMKHEAQPHPPSASFSTTRCRNPSRLYGNLCGSRDTPLLSSTSAPTSARSVRSSLLGKLRPQRTQQQQPPVHFMRYTPVPHLPLLASPHLALLGQQASDEASARTNSPNAVGVAQITTYRSAPVHPTLMPQLCGNTFQQQPCAFSPCV